MTQATTGIPGSLINGDVPPETNGRTPSLKEIGKFMKRMMFGVRGQSTETVNPRYENLDMAPNEEILENFNEVQVRAIAAVDQARPQIAKAAQAMIERLGDKGRIIYVGAGTSGRLGAVDGMELGPTFDFDDSRVVIGMAEDHELKLGTSREGREDDVWRADENVEKLKLTKDDVVICIAASGKTPYTQRFAQLARKKGSLVIGMANNLGSPLLEGDVDIPILLETGAEVIRGSSRMGAGTAQKVALTELTSLVMAKLPGIYGMYRGQMPNMRDANVKLQKRNADMVANFAGVALEKAGEAVKTAMTFFVDKTTGIRNDTITKEATLIALGATPQRAGEILTETRRDFRKAIEMQRADVGLHTAGDSEITMTR